MIAKYKKSCYRSRDSVRVEGKLLQHVIISYMTERLTLTVNLWDAWSFLTTPSTCDGICTLGRWSRKNKFPNAAKCTSLIKDEWLWWTRVRWDLKDLWKIKAWRKWSNSGEPIFNSIKPRCELYHVLNECKQRR